MIASKCFGSVYTSCCLNAGLQYLDCFVQISLFYWAGLQKIIKHLFQRAHNPQWKSDRYWNKDVVGTTSFTSWACFCKESSDLDSYVGRGGCSPTFAWEAAALSWAGIWVFRLEQPGMGASQPWYFPIARHKFTLDLQISNVSQHWLLADEPELTHVKFKTVVGFSELCQPGDNGLSESRQVQNFNGELNI